MPTHLDGQDHTRNFGQSPAHVHPPPPPPWEALPTELWMEICDNLKTRSLINVRLVRKFLRPIVTPLLFTKVVVDSSYPSTRSSSRSSSKLRHRMDFLKAIIRRPPTNLGRHVRCLEIIYSGVAPQGPAAHRLHDTSDMEKRNYQSAMLNGLLSREFLWFCSLHKFRLQIQDYRPSEQELEPLRQVVTAIADMRSVVDLKVDIETQCYPDIWSRVSKFRGLQYLVLEGSFNSLTVKSLLSTSPSISRLDLANFYGTLFKIRDAMPWMSTSPTLQVLNIDCLGTRNECGAIRDKDAAALLPFLPNVKSLAISSISVSDLLWERLASRNYNCITSLELLDAGPVSPSLLEFLTSHGILEKLSIIFSDSAWHTMTHANIPARFWADVPWRNRKTLQSLELLLWDEETYDLWDITERGFQGLRECSQLRSVHICLRDRALQRRLEDVKNAQANKKWPYLKNLKFYRHQ